MSGPTPPAAASLVPANGEYADGAAGEPRYLISLAHTSPSTGKGLVTFVYQDGRSQGVATYTGVVSDGRLTMRLDNQRTMSGPVSIHGFVLTNCQAALRWAIKPQQCAFTYVG